MRFQAYLVCMKMLFLLGCSEKEFDFIINTSADAAYWQGMAYYRQQNFESAYSSFSQALNLLTKEDYKEGKVGKVILPKSNVIKLIFENDMSVTIRPSGTEPKLKLYYSVKGKDALDAKHILDEFVARFEEYLAI